LFRFFLLYTTLFAGFGVASPFLPILLQTRGLRSEEIGLILALSTAVRLVSGPLAGRAADFLDALRGVFASFAVAGALAAFGYLPANSFRSVLVVSIIYAAMLAPLTTTADALALRAVGSSGEGHRRLEYGWVRGAGSAAFIVGSLVAGQAIVAIDLNIIIWGSSAFLVAAAAAAMALQVPRSTARTLPGGAAPFPPSRARHGEFGDFADSSASLSCRSAASRTGVPSSSVTRSPGLSPARSAADCGSRRLLRAAEPFLDVERRLGVAKDDHDAKDRVHRKGVLFSAGLITGEALIGIFMAIPIVALGEGRRAGAAGIVAPRATCARPLFNTSSSCCIAWMEWRARVIAKALPSSGIAVINELPGTNSSGGTCVIARTPYLLCLSPQL
jgi:MFS family permease